MADRVPSAQFTEDSLKWRGVALTGKYAHWCFDWDDLPLDETCPEWPCGCGIVEHVDERERAKAEQAEALRLYR